MKTLFKVSSGLLDEIRKDLARPHPFAFERVGFISAGLGLTNETILILARDYRPVDDRDYLRDYSVGAMMGPEAIRKAMQWALESRSAIFHVHSHGLRGLPAFSPVDIRENAKFVPDLFKVAPQYIHGAIVLSDNAASGQVWLERNHPPSIIEEFVEVGPPIWKWRSA